MEKMLLRRLQSAKGLLEECLILKDLHKSKIAEQGDFEASILIAKKKVESVIKKINDQKDKNFYEDVR